MNAKSDDTNDLDVLLPDRDITLRGEPVTVREFSFVQGLKAEPLVRPMINDLQTLFAAEAGEDVEFSRLAEIFGRHADAFLRLVSLCVDRPVEWIEQLSDEDGQLLTMTFWTVNARFFTRRLVMRELTSLVRREVNVSAAASAPSSPH